MPTFIIVTNVFNDGVFGEWGSLPVHLPIASLVDQLLDCLQVGIPASPQKVVTYMNA